MKIIVAVDDQNGMMFNHRRQSQDSVLRKRILELTEGSVLRMNAYSAKQFRGEEERFEVSEQFLEEAKEGEYCFVENVPIQPYAEKVEEMIVCKWNRIYPSDRKLDLNPEHSMKLERTEEFPGSSHEKITMEVWKQ